MDRMEAGSDIAKISAIKARRRRVWLPFNVALALPAQLTVLAVVLIPTVVVIWLSLTSWQPTQGIPWYDARLIWFHNFYRLLADPRFLSAVGRTLFLVLICMAAEFVLALGLALLFLDDWKWKKVAVSIIILPMMVVPVDAANSFFMLFNDRGPINYLIGLVLGRPFQYAWLANPNWALVPIMLAEIWQWTPLMFLLLLTGLMNLPENQIRAAYMLGASRTRVFLRIMLPLMAPVISIALLVRSIETFKIFDPVYILTRGGPGTSTETISMYMYKEAFVNFRIGYVASAALLVLVLVVAICLAMARSLNRYHR